VPTVHHVTPTWITAFDLYPLQSVDSKLHWLTAAARGGWVCGFGHETGVAFAAIRQRDGRFQVSV